MLSHYRLAGRYLRGTLLRLGPDGPVAPAGILLQTDHGDALPGRCGGLNCLPHRHAGPAAGSGRRRGSRGVFRRCATRATRATHIWTETGKERPLLTVSGRERVNLNAALNAHCPTQVYLDETDCVNAQSTQRLYEKLLIAHPEGPVHVVCDNARYYKNKALPAWLADKRLVPVFLPPYSPNLNLIERLWKFLRQKIINTAIYRTKGQFKTAVLDFFDRLDEFGPELASRMRLKFHVLDSQPNS